MTIRQDFLSRGFPVNKPASESDLSLLDKYINGPVHDDWRNIYGNFNGFLENCACEKSQIYIWSIKEIVDSNLNLSKWEYYWPFADEFIGADIFMCNFKDPGQPILKYNDRSVASGSAADFIYDLVSGNYDLEGKKASGPLSPLP